MNVHGAGWTLRLCKAPTPLMEENCSIALGGDGHRVALASQGLRALGVIPFHVNSARYTAPERATFLS